MTKEDVEHFCRWIGLEKFIIEPDLSLTINENVDRLILRDMEKLPVKINKVDGYFKLTFHKPSLTTFENYPKFVSDSCIIKNQRFTSLEHAPEIVGGDFDISSNKHLTSFKYLPKQMRSLIAFGITIKDPYEWRYILFSEIRRSINIVLPIGTPEVVIKINVILQDYLGKHNQNHLAIDKLLTLGESLGFKYD